MTPEDIIARVARARGITVRRLRGAGIDPSSPLYANPRHESQWLIRKTSAPTLSYSAIGKFFLGRDHSSVIAGIKKIDRLVGADPAYGDQLLALVGIGAKQPDHVACSGCIRSAA